jgi:hypothetical protein
VNTLYRIEVASCLAAAFQAEQACAGRSRSELVDDLFRRFSLTPSERLLELHDELGDHERPWLATLFFVSNEAMRLLGTEGVREKLVANRSDRPTEQLHAELVRLVEQLEAALFQLFYRTRLLQSLTERLALFG